MFCKNCGKQIEDKIEFCPYCGTATEDSNPVAPVTTDESFADGANNTTVSANPDKKSKKINIYAIIGFVLSICSWFFAIFINYHEYVCTAIGAASLALCIVGVVFAEKKNYNLKGVSIAGLVISTVAVVLWPLTLL